MPDEPLTPLQVFVITFVGRLADLCMDMEAFTALLCAALRARRGARRGTRPQRRRHGARGAD